MKLIIAAIALATSSMAIAGSCPTQMKEIDAKLSTSPKLSTADMDKVKTLRSDGAAFHKAGKHAESEKALRGCQEVVGNIKIRPT